MPGWVVVVQRRPHYAIVRQLERLTQLSLLRVSDGFQRSIEGYFSRVPAPPKSGPARPATPAPAIQAPASNQTRPSAAVPPDCAARPTSPQNDAEAREPAVVADEPVPPPP